MAKKERCCELCSSEARMFCESDQARLCWDCDDKVHAANFLVAKHTRTAICQVCHSATPWKASGVNLGRVVSVCGACVAGSARVRRKSNSGGGIVAEDGMADRRRNVRIADERRGRYLHREEREDDSEYDDRDTEDDDDYDSDGEDDSLGCDDDCDDDDENQVVPGTSMPSTSGSEDEVSSVAVDDGESASTSGFRDSAVRSRVVSEEEEEILPGEFARPWKQRRVAK